MNHKFFLYLLLVFLTAICVFKYVNFNDDKLNIEAFQNLFETQTTRALLPFEQNDGQGEEPRITKPPTEREQIELGLKSETIIEKSLKNLYGGALRLLCNLNPLMKQSDCMMEDKKFAKYLFPIHLLHMPNSKIVAVFNDGRLYEKDTLLSNMWKGPLKNSLPYDYIPLRMITINYRDNSLLGVGFDNRLYAKQSDELGNIDILGEWKLVPGNSNIIHVIIDRDTKKLVAVDINGKLIIKKKNDLLSEFEPLGDLREPILKLFYDSNGYMLALNTRFNLVQFRDKNWKQSELNYEKGINRFRVYDILYDNDGKLFGLVMVPKVGMLELMKQQQIYFMSDFVPLEFHTKQSLEAETNYLLNDVKIIELKTGVNIIEDNDDYGDESRKDDDLTYAYMKSVINNKTKLREFCRKRGVGNANVFDNYDMLNNLQEQERQIGDLRSVIANLLKYEPEKHKIQEELLLMK